MHVFKYSKRSGTRAAHMSGQVREEVKQERSELLREEARAGAERLRSRHVGIRAGVVWEGERDGVWRGLTDTNVRAYGGPNAARVGGMSSVRLGSTFRDGLWAEPLQAEMPLVPVSSVGRST
jgi:threonylcarbamoyladenosine tRNA methylthiotransferase MtaB